MRLAINFDETTHIERAIDEIRFTLVLASQVDAG